jgi:hypothetical protein
VVGWRSGGQQRGPMCLVWRKIPDCFLQVMCRSGWWLVGVTSFFHRGVPEQANHEGCGYSIHTHPSCSISAQFIVNMLRKWTNREQGGKHFMFGPNIPSVVNNELERPFMWAWSLVKHTINARPRRLSDPKLAAYPSCDSLVFIYHLFATCIAPGQVKQSVR